MKSQRLLKGFTLIEIMIVVAIIVLVAALAIPNFLRSRLNANEAAAIASMRVISSAAISYRVVNPSFPENLSLLAAAVPAYIDSFLGAGSKQGYNFTVVGDASSFNATAIPHAQNVTGVRSFFVDVSGIVRASSNGSVDATSPPIS
jgi:prepilin-type N-terminal cleavage/methylation domain-containing protein